MEQLSETSDRLTEEAAEQLLQRNSDTVPAVVQPENSLEVYKKSQSLSVRLGDEYCYWLCLLNRSAQTLKRLVITDELAEGLELIADSLWLDGRRLEGDITKGLVIPELLSGDFLILSYAVRVCSRPSSDSFSNSAHVHYRLAEGGSAVAVSNTLEVILESCELQMGYYVQPTSGNCGERINCTGYITNAGTWLLEEAYLRLNLPYGACLLPETLSFDETVPLGTDWQQICLGPLAPGQTIRFSYQMQVLVVRPCKTCGQASAFGYCSSGLMACSKLFTQDFYWNQSCL